MLALNNTKETRLTFNFRLALIGLGTTGPLRNKKKQILETLIFGGTGMGMRISGRAYERQFTVPYLESPDNRACRPLKDKSPITLIPFSTSLFLMVGL